MNPTLNLYKTILVLLNNNGTKKPAINIRNGEICYIEEIKVGVGKNSVQVFSLVNNAPSVIEFDMVPESFITLSDFAENNGNYRENSGKFAELLRNYIGTFPETFRNSIGEFADNSRTISETLPDDFGSDNGEIAETYRRFIGKGTIDRIKVSHHYSGETAKVITDIEKLTDKICKHTTKKETQQKAAEFYDLCVKTAEANELDKIQKLKSIRYELEKTSNKQDLMIEQNAVQKQDSGFWFNSKKYAWVIIILFAVGMLFWTFYEPVKKYEQVKTEIKKTINETIEKYPIAGKITGTDKKAPAKKVHTAEEIENLINQVAEEQKIKIWEFSRNKIKTACQNKELTNWEVKNIIKKQTTKK